MKRYLVAVVMLGVVVAAEAKQLNGLVGVWGTNAATYLQNRGYPPEDAAAVAGSGDDETTVLERVLKNRDYELVYVITRYHDTLSDAGRAQLQSALAEEADMSKVRYLPQLVRMFPVEERVPYAAAVDAQLAAGDMKDRPVARGMWAKYDLGADCRTVAGMSTEDLVELLLAPEPKSLSGFEWGGWEWQAAGPAAIKNEIKERAVRLARQALRAEGKSFVMKDGVNPLVAKLQPLVDALNAPNCVGLEAALRGLGVESADRDRKPLAEVVAAYSNSVMIGESLDAEREIRLGTLAVGLGVEGYNRF